MDIEKLRSSITSFSLDKCNKGNQGFSRILIQLFGFLGHGKSAFINTCIYVLEDGEYDNWAKAKEEDGGSTTERIPYKLTQNITLVDNRGLGKMDGYETGEIFAQLGNLIPLGKVEWPKNFELVDRITSAEKTMTTSDFIFPVFVHSVQSTIENEKQEDIKKVLQTSTRLTGVSPIVVLTHKSSGNLIDTEKVFRNMGVDKIFSFENYTREDHIKLREKHKEVLKFLHEVIKDVRFRMEHQPQDPVKEILERKIFVMNYIYECGLKAQQEKILKQRADKQVQLQKQKEKQENEMRMQREKERHDRDMELNRRKEELEEEKKRQLKIQEDELEKAKNKRPKNKKKKRCCNCF
ncbi:uncharacterized protein LOC144000376 [Lithobates pipiens]